MNRLMLAIFTVLIVAPLSASIAMFPMIVPPGVHPGDRYQLVFVTAGTRNALSSTIADYNAFVNQDANSFHIGPDDFTQSGVPIHWHAIVSVFGTNAKENAQQNAPAYNLAGDLVANGGPLTNFLYQPPLLSPVKWSPDGASNPRLVFTGTNFTGIASTFPAGTGTGVTSGNSNDVAETWITLGFGSAGTEPPAVPMSIYALSDPLTAPVPEPSTLILAGLGAFVALCSAVTLGENKRV
jgi:PEP-CTERM motif